MSNFNELTESMASSSSSVNNSQYCPRWKYDVFLSFRGEDTRKTFTGHLYEGLKNRGILTFQDARRIEHGDSIPEELMKAIKESQVALVVFSKNYATSRWCLNELVEIMERKDENGQLVIPVFYNVDPSEVRNQRESFAESFAKHESNYKDVVDGVQKVQGWRAALTAAANLKGYDIRGGIESENLQQIVDHISFKLCDVCWFGNGSRVIVTTRNRHLIDKDDAIYEVPTLPIHEAMQLFNQCAFKKEVPDERLKKFSLELVNHAKGLPLALKVWGSLLHKRGIDEWKKTVDKIKKNSSLEILEKLKISYDGLEPEEQKIFLDLACFFRRSGRNRVLQILESCDFRAEYGLNVLIDKSLVFISKSDTIEMHDLIQDMGRYVVKMQKESGEPSRIWDIQDFEEVMIDNTGTKAMEAIWIYGVQKLCFSKKAMKNMKRLRILYISGFDTHDDSIEYLPNSLRWFECHKYPWKLLPETFEPKRLVHLDLHLSLLRHLWNGIKHLPSLRKLNLYHSKRLRRTPDFTGMPNLEYLGLEWCSNLEEIHHSLECCRKLIELNLYNCEHLKRFPCVNMESLGSLDLRYCSSLENFPEILGRMKPELKIKMEGSGIRELPSSIIHYQACITELHLIYMENLVALPRSIGMLKGLVKLDVSYCSKLEILPEDIGDLENLVKLYATCTLISRPPSSIVRLNKLKFLTFAKQQSEVFFVFPQVNEGLHSLEDLYLSNCNLIDGGLPEDIGCLSSLKRLYINGNNFEHLPQSIAQLGVLQSLDLKDCKRLKELPGFMGMPNLNTLNLSYCKQLKIFPALCIDSLKYLDLEGCSSLEKIPEILGSMKVESEIHMLDSVLRNLNLMCISSLSQRIVSLQHDIYASDSFSLRVFSIEHGGNKIPSWFHHQGMDESVSVKMPENWYASDNFLGFVVCYNGRLMNVTTHLIPLCDDEMSWMTLKLDLSYFKKLDAEIIDYSESDIECSNYPVWDTESSNNSAWDTELSNYFIADTEFSNYSVWDTELSNPSIHFFLVPLAGLWDTSKANGKTPNDYRFVKLSFSGETKEFGFRLLYKDEPDLEALLLQMRENNDEPTEHSIGTRIMMNQ